MSKADMATINLMEAEIRAMISEVSLREFAVALNNAFCFGDVFEGAISDEGLSKLFDHIDGISKVAKEEDV